MHPADPTPPSGTTRPISSAEARAVRAPVLRPGQPLAAAAMDRDDADDTFHAGAFDAAGRLVSVATVYPEPMAEPLALAPAGPKRTGPAFRLRGMATLPEAQRRGASRAVLACCRRHVRAHGSAFIWCNARVGALGFYEREGFVRVGDAFEIAGIGPHFVMWRPA